MYAERLLSGTKRFEYRRRPISRELTHIIVYASSPLKRIVGVLEVSEVHTYSPRQAWARTKRDSGISKHEFDAYFAEADTAFAIEINPEATMRLNRMLLPVEIHENFKIPQSFMYVGEDFLQQVRTLGQE